MTSVVFRFRLTNSIINSEVKLVAGQTSVQAKLAPHPLFSQVKQIHLKSDQLNLKCLQLFQNNEVSIAPEKSKDFVKRCKQVFQIQPEIITEEIGVNLLLNRSDQDTQFLDFLDFSDLLLIIKSSFDKTGVKLHPKIMRKLKFYCASTKRKQTQKQVIQKIVKSYKQTEKINDENVNEKQYVAQKSMQMKPKQKFEPRQQKTDQKQVQIKRQQRQRANRNQQRRTKASSNQTQSQAEYKEQKEQNIAQYQNDQQFQEERSPRNKDFPKKRRSKRSQRNQDNFEDSYKDRYNKKSSEKRRNYSQSRNQRSGQKYRDGNSKQKNFDPKILLGLTGDTQFGWRQRQRPTRVPARNQLQVQSENKVKNYQQKQKKYATQRQNQERRRKNANQSKQVKQNKQQQEEIVNNEQDWEDQVEGEEGQEQVEQTQAKQQKRLQNKQKQQNKKEQAQKKYKQKERESDKNTSKKAEQQKQAITKQPSQKKNLDTRTDQPAKVLEDGSKLIFTYPANGEKFDFNKIKQQFKILINGKFWVNFKDGILEIVKGEKKYVRQNTKIDAFSNKLMSEGLTLNLDGSSNLQDGGELVGDPKIQEFTGTNSQFFHVVTMDVYVPK